MANSKAGSRKVEVKLLISSSVKNLKIAQIMLEACQKDTGTNLKGLILANSRKLSFRSYKMNI